MINRSINQIAPKGLDNTKHTIDESVLHFDEFADGKQLHLESSLSLHRIEVYFILELLIDLGSQCNTFLLGFAVIIEDAPFVDLWHTYLCFLNVHLSCEQTL